MDLAFGRKERKKNSEMGGFETRPLCNWNAKHTLRNLLRKYMQGEGLHNEEVTWVPSYPRKRVSRPIGRRPNLDSRVRGNDAFKQTAYGGNPIHFHIL